MLKAKAFWSFRTSMDANTKSSRALQVSHVPFPWLLCCEMKVNRRLLESLSCSSSLFSTNFISGLGCAHHCSRPGGGLYYSHSSLAWVVLMKQRGDQTEIMLPGPHVIKPAFNYTDIWPGWVSTTKNFWTPDSVSSHTKPSIHFHHTHCESDWTYVCIFWVPPRLWGVKTPLKLHLDLHHRTRWWLTSLLGIPVKAHPTLGKATQPGDKGLENGPVKCHHYSWVDFQMRSPGERSQAGVQQTFKGCKN